MKRTACLICLALFAAVSFAQQKHLKFMGIPIDGTITQFQKKLEAKGCTAIKGLNSYLPVGQRAFAGTFVGKQAQICAFYDSDTKIVYRVKVYYPDLSDDMADQEYSRIKAMLVKKYADSFWSAEDDSGKIFSLSPKRWAVDMYSREDALGDIDVYVLEDEEHSYETFRFSLHIDYMDYINYDRHESNELEDL